MAEAKGKRPKVGVCVFVTTPDHPGCVLLGVRKNTEGVGTYGLPGGHLEYGESFEDCGRRELLEETGLKLISIHMDTVFNAFCPEEQYHSVDIVMRGEIDQTFKSEPENMEPHKCEGWGWYEWDKLSVNLFRPLEIIKEGGYSPFTSRTVEDS